MPERLQNRAAWTDEFTMLCERCGYVLDRLPPHAACPECGEPIEHSLPTERPGSPWERRPSVASFLSTAWAVARHPNRTFRALSFRDQTAAGAGRLLVAHATIASLLCAVSAMAWTKGGNVEGTSAFSLMAAVVFIVIIVLSELEMAGARLIGRSQQWRLSRPITRSICAHAAVGWWVAGLLTGLALRWTVVTRSALNFSPHTRSPWWYEWVWWAWTLSPFLGFVVGLLVFESLVFVGMKRCRFANRHRPNHPKSTNTA